MSHSLRYTVNCSMLFTELPLLERPGAAKAAGFDAVEFWWPFAEAVPSDQDVDGFVSAVQDAGVRLTGLNFFAGDMPGGDRGLVSWPARRQEFVDNVDVVVGIAERLGTRAFNALYGNRVDGATAEAQDELAVENLAAAAKAVGTLTGPDGGVVLVEPVSGAPRYPILTAAEALAVLDRTHRAGADNVRLLCDLYHLATNGDDLTDAVRNVGPIGHVQIADAPGRGEPGTGELDIEGYLTTLQAGGYDGYVGLEYKPTTTTEESLAWLPRERRASA